VVDNNSTATLGRLAYSIANEPSNVHDLPLRRSDRVFQLVVLGEQVAGTNDITVDLANISGMVKIYEIMVGYAPIKTLKDVTSFPLSISDHALVLEIHK
jgi:hypothetical protein